MPIRTHIVGEYKRLQTRRCCTNNNRRFFERRPTHKQTESNDVRSDSWRRRETHVHEQNISQVNIYFTRKTISTPSDDSSWEALLKFNYVCIAPRLKSCLGFLTDLFHSLFTQQQQQQFPFIFDLAPFGSHCRAVFFILHCLLCYASTVHSHSH